MEIKIHKPEPSEIAERGVKSWPIWEKEVSRFDWHYDQTEECYLLEGRVIVETPAGKSVEFGEGDFVEFPCDMDCIWDIKEGVRKHYNFK